MNTSSRQKVVIIGAGPGGLVSALVLAHFGIQPYLIEKELQTNPFTKALTLQPRTLELLDALGLLDELLARGNIISRNNIRIKGKTVSTLDYTNLPSKCNYLLSITQPEVEICLLQALAKLGVTIHRGIECTNVTRHEQELCITVKDHQDAGKVSVIHSEYVLAADGGKSTIRSLLLDKQEVSLTHQARYNSNFIMGDFVLKDYPFARNERETFFAKGTLCALVPMTYPQVRIIAFGLDKPTNETPLPSEFQEIAYETTGISFDLREGYWLSRFYPARFILNRFQLDNLFLIGDAAHIISPISAQGINLSIGDGYNLAWKLGLVCTQRAGPSILQSYERERMHTAREVLHNSDAMHTKLANVLRFFCFVQQLKFLKNPHVTQTVLLKQTQFAMCYPSDAVNARKEKGSGRLSAGDPLTNAICSQPKASRLFDWIPVNELTLMFNYLSADSPKEQVDPKLQEHFHCLAINHPSSLTIPQITLDEDAPLYHLLKASPFFLVISPEHYVRNTYHSTQPNDEILSQLNLRVYQEQF